MAWINYRSRFLFKNLLKGLLGLSIIVIMYILLQKHSGFDDFMEVIGQWPILVYTAYALSEIIFGIIPPEVFMIWTIKHGLIGIYALDIAFLAIISYSAGVLGYFIGTLLKKRMPYVFKRYILRYRNTLNRFGGFLIIVGAVTPIPFSAICMLVGATNYHFGRFMLIACARFIRFGVYSFIIYQANI